MLTNNTNGEMYLLNLGEVVSWIFIEDKFPYWAERELCMRPDLCKIKDIVTEFLSLLRRHRLLKIRQVVVIMNDVDTHNVHSPGWIIIGLNGIEKFLNAIVRVLTG